MMLNIGVVSNMNGLEIEEMKNELMNSPVITTYADGSKTEKWYNENEALHIARCLKGLEDWE